MRFNNKFDLNLLVALDHLLHLSSVSSAAARMNVTQSAMSNALLRLRTYFDDDLLVKMGRSMKLTPRAEALKDSIRDLLVRIEWTVASTSEFDPAQSDRCFKISVSDYSLLTLVPKLVANCEKAAPHVRMDLQPQVVAPERALERGDIDLLIIPREFGSKLHPSEAVVDETFCAVVWNKGRFAQGSISRRDFEIASHVVMRPPGGAQSLETSFLEKRGVNRRNDITTYNFSSIPHLVVGTDRIATLHMRLARLAQKSLPLRIVKLPFPLPKMQQTMQWHRYRSNDSGIVWLRNMIRAAAAE